jgi:hypothetical protein
LYGVPNGVVFQGLLNVADAKLTPVIGVDAGAVVVVRVNSPDVVDPPPLAEVTTQKYPVLGIRPATMS